MMFPRYTLVTAALAMGCAGAAAVARGQTSDGIVDLVGGSVGSFYVNTDENGQSWGTPTDQSTVASVEALTVTGVTPGALGLTGTTLYLFSSEVGEPAPSGGSTAYQILDASSLAYADATRLAGTPNPQPDGSPFDGAAGIGAGTGIGAYRALQIERLYGYAFNANSGVLSHGYAPQSLSLVDQVAFQLAVWKLANEGAAGSPASYFAMGSQQTSSGFSVTGGGLDCAITDEANSLLCAVQHDSCITPMALDGLNNGTDGDFLLPQNSLAQIPEPSATATVQCLAALGLALVFRIRSKAARA